MTRARRARTKHGSAKLPVAVFLATAVLVVATMAATGLVADAQEAGVSGSDSDGNVPVRSVCFGAEQYGTGAQYAGEDQYVGGGQYAGEQYAGPQYATDQFYAGVQYATGGQYASDQLALYSWYNDGYSTYGSIAVDDCALDAMGAGPQDRERVLAHERGHADGLLHSDDPADLMYPIVPIRGARIVGASTPVAGHRGAPKAKFAFEGAVTPLRTNNSFPDPALFWRASSGP